MLRTTLYRTAFCRLLPHYTLPASELLYRVQIILYNESQLIELVLHKGMYTFAAWLIFHGRFV